MYWVFWVYWVYCACTAGAGGEAEGLLRGVDEAEELELAHATQWREIAVSEAVLRRLVAGFAPWELG